MDEEQKLNDHILKLEKELMTLSYEINEHNGIIENMNYSLFHLNSEISGFNKYFKIQQQADQQNQLLEIDQKERIYIQYLQQTEQKIRQNMQFVYQQKYADIQAAKNKSQQNSMEVGTVCVFYFQKNPYINVLEQQKQKDMMGEDFFSLDFVCKTFALKKDTVIQEIFETACIYWSVSQAEYTMTDKDFNCLELLYQNNAEGYFVCHKDSNSYALFCLFEKIIHVDYIFQQQKDSIRLPGTSDPGKKDENLTRFNSEIKDLKMLKKGLDLYTVADQDEDSKQDMISKEVGIIPKTIFLLINLFLMFQILSGCLNYYDRERITMIKLSMTQLALGLPRVNQTSNTIDAFPENLDVIFQKLQDFTLLNATIRNFKYLTVVGLLQVHQERTQECDCLDNETLKCYYPIYDKNNRKTDDIEVIEDTEDQGSEDQGSEDQGAELGGIQIEGAELGGIQIEGAELGGIQIEGAERVGAEEGTENQGSEEEGVPIEGEEEEQGNEYKVKDWKQWQSQEQTGITPFEGLISKYDGSGYIFEFDTYENDMTQIQNIQNKGWAKGPIPQMQKLSIVLYDINGNIYITIDYVVEITSSGEFFQQSDVNIFRKNFLHEEVNASEKQILGIGVFGIIIMVSFDVWKKYWEIKISSGSVQNVSYKNLFINCVFDLQFVVNLTNLILHIILYQFLLQDFNIEPEELKVKISYNSLQTHAKQQTTALTIKAYLLILFSIKVLVNISNAISITFIKQIISKSFVTIIMIGLLILTLTLGYSYIYFWTYGSDLYQFNTFYRSFLSYWSIYMFGNSQLWIQCQTFNSSVNGIMTIVQFFTISYGTLTLLNSVVQESYRIISYRQSHIMEIERQKKQLIQQFEQIVLYIKSSKLYKNLTKRK